MEKEILTAREWEVINKKMNYKRLNQLDSNVLTKSVRPKLREILKINAEALLERLNYNPSARLIENKIRKLILENIKDTEAIIVFGSAIYTSYSSYNDIDALVVTKKKIFKNQLDKYKTIHILQEKATEKGLNLDIEILEKKAISSFPYNPALIYQLKDSKQIFGKLDIPRKINLSKLDLRMKLDWSDIEDSGSEPLEIYQAIRNALLVRLLMDSIIDNNQLYSKTIEALGKELALKLKQNKATKIEKKYALSYLKNLIVQIRAGLLNAKWERIEL